MRPSAFDYCIHDKRQKRLGRPISETLRKKEKYREDIYLNTKRRQYHRRHKEEAVSFGARKKEYSVFEFGALRV
ncbi:hypothetical protein HanRHA438_Chr15g0727591 [Helianthus annuus]|uniref:Uncharacterized protein n=1 Tax=Helianthus annuus TaxID=4232 RepID=A0A9K3H547_HELAN|nr:hypothetical protein HanXRQr2_Chr15g0715391 [Helianthus annuus]KAJ0452818.1 hypothetical protein HanHA300_Chr15g0583331 [Helianthus annuus]KAJ0457832.1 hypothetical protein HanIR_Chr15g0778271 [Helianthus annuus]KAJ0474732.1 hypothetical protein HanHA89_Chr15g0633121 [Helianthus annuus]KAJ0650286.1 hypothetical protein HanLR1_Chr15g0594021 [Helianthus annuus]